MSSLNTVVALEKFIFLREEEGGYVSWERQRLLDCADEVQVEAGRVMLGFLRRDSGYANWEPARPKMKDFYLLCLAEIVSFDKNEGEIVAFGEGVWLLRLTPSQAVLRGKKRVSVWLDDNHRFDFIPESLGHRPDPGRIKKYLGPPC